MSPTTRNTTRKNSMEPATANAPRVTMADAPARPEDEDPQIRQNERDINDCLINSFEPIPYDLSAAATSLMGSINDEQMMGQLQDALLPQPAAPNNQSGHGQHASTMAMNQQQQQYVATATQHGADHRAGTTMTMSNQILHALARILSTVNVSQQHLDAEPAYFPSHGALSPAVASMAALVQGYHDLLAMSTQNVAIALESVLQWEYISQASMAKRTNDLDEKSAQHRQNTARLGRIEVALQNALDHQRRERKIAEEQEKANDEQVKTQLTKYQEALFQKKIDDALASEQDKANTELVAQKELAYEEALLQQEMVLDQVQQTLSELRDSLTQQKTDQQEAMAKHHSYNAIVQQEKSK